MKRINEIISYIFWGGVTTAVNWVAYAVCVKFFAVSPNVSNIIAWVVAVAVAYVTNKIFVFDNKSWHNIGKELGLFLSARIFSGVVEILGLPLLMSTLNWGALFGIEGFGEKLILSVFVIVSNYFFSKLVIFKK